MQEIASGRLPGASRLPEVHPGDSTLPLEPRAELLNAEGAGALAHSVRLCRVVRAATQKYCGDLHARVSARVAHGREG